MGRLVCFASSRGSLGGLPLLIHTHIFLSIKRSSTEHDRVKVLLSLVTRSWESDCLLDRVHAPNCTGRFGHERKGKRVVSRTTVLEACSVNQPNANSRNFDVC